MNQDFEIMDKYLSGQLTEGELKLFEERLRKEPDLKESLCELKLVRSAVREGAKRDVLNFLKEKEAEIQSAEKKKATFGVKKFIPIAAVFLLLTTVGYFALFHNKTEAVTGQMLYTAYYDGPYMNIVSGTERGTTDLEETLESKAYLAYDIGEYAEAARCFKVLTEEKKTATNYFYAGVSNLEAGNLTDAKVYFRAVLDDFDMFKEQAQWYMAMTSLKENNIKEALSSLAPLRKDSKYADEVDKILEALESK